ncbi:MAG: hypothetical protein ABIH70_09005 [Chloroflexota bacterium]
MSKKLKILVGVLAAVLLLAGGTVAVMAQDEPTTPPAVVAGANTTLTEVAGILGISETQLTDAIKQARQEVRDENITTALENAVANGSLTQAQADEISTWWSQRPEALNSGSMPFGFGPMGRAGRQMGGLRLQAGSQELLAKVATILNISEEELTNAFKQARQEISDARLSAMLDKAVTNGRLTQDQADQFEGWWAECPSDLGAGPFAHRFESRFAGRHMLGGMQGMMFR